MQISAPISSSITQLPAQRRGLAEHRQQEPVQIENNRDITDRSESPFGIEPSLNSDRLTAQTIDPSRELNNISDALQGKDFPLNTRKALQTFAENKPSAQQQLGVELAGINTFA